MVGSVQQCRHSCTSICDFMLMHIIMYMVVQTAPAQLLVHVEGTLASCYICLSSAAKVSDIIRILRISKMITKIIFKSTDIAVLFQNWNEIRPTHYMNAVLLRRYRLMALSWFNLGYPDPNAYRGAAVEVYTAPGRCTSKLVDLVQ